MDDLSEFGFRFKLLLDISGFDRKYLAEKLDISVSLVSQVIRGERSLSYEKLSLLAKCTDVNLHWLLTGSGSIQITEGSIAPKYLEIFSLFQHELDRSLKLVKNKLIHDIPTSELEKLDIPFVLEVEKAAMDDEKFVSKFDSAINFEEVGHYPKWLDAEIKRLMREGISRKEAVLAVKERRYAYVRADAVSGEGINFRKIYRYLLSQKQ